MKYHYAKLSGEQTAELDRLQSRFCQEGKNVVLLAVEQPSRYAVLDEAALKRITALEQELSGGQEIALVAYDTAQRCC